MVMPRGKFAAIKIYSKDKLDQKLKSLADPSSS